MGNWFYKLESMLSNGEVISDDLIGAGQATAKRAIAHYRYQQKEKVKEAIEDTFPVLKKLVGEDWSSLVESFYSTNQNSPRSLDFISKVFLNHIQNLTWPVYWKELARFEYCLEIHPWSHRQYYPIPLDSLSEESKLVLDPLDFQIFRAPVVEFYEGIEVSNLEQNEEVLIWMNGGVVHYKKMEEWEIRVLAILSEGIIKAVEYAPDEKKATEFFTWLGTANLIRELR